MINFIPINQVPYAATNAAQAISISHHGIV